MAKKETIVEDKMYDAILESFKSFTVWYRGTSKHFEELPDEALEERLRYYRRCYNSVRKENWVYASWRSVDKYKIAVEYLESILQDRMDKLFNDFKFVKI